MLVKETWVNATKGYRCGDSDYYEPYTDDIKRLYKDFMREYGRCIGKVYVDGSEGQAIPVGYVYQKLQKYDDCNEKYLQETWVTFYDDKPTITKVEHYHKL